jgi:hypothetical protein
LGWIRNRNPRRDELRPHSLNRQHTALGGYFLVWDSEVIDIDYYEIPATRTGNEQDDGYWLRPGVVAWQHLPMPPDNTEEEEDHGAYRRDR